MCSIPSYSFVLASSSNRAAAFAAVSACSAYFCNVRFSGYFNNAAAADSAAARASCTALDSFSISDNFEAATASSSAFSAASEAIFPAFSANR